MRSDESGLTDGYDRLSIPEKGEQITYEDGFRSPDEPIVPVAHGATDTVITLTRRVLEEAAILMGRNIHWLRVYMGQEAQDRYANSLPEDTVLALRQFRVGLIGTPTESREAALQIQTDLHHRVGLTAAVDHCSQLESLPPLFGSDHHIDLTVVRDITEDSAAAIEFPSESTEAVALREFLLSTVPTDERIPEGPTGYSVRPISVNATHAVVDAAMDYAFDQDRNTVTIVHQGDRLSASEGSFRECANTYLEDEYSDAIIHEQTFREKYNGNYPDDELVILERLTDEICLDLLSSPDEYDVVLAPAVSGMYVSTVATGIVGGVGVAPKVTVGNGRVIATPRLTPNRSSGTVTENPIGTLLSGCLLFEYIGWEDTAKIVRSAISKALADGLLPRDLYRRSASGTLVTADEFADAVIERLTRTDRDAGSGGVRTTIDERAEIRESIAGLYNTVFEDQLSPDEIELNQLLGEDEEADVYLPAVGLNFYYWRRWPIERRIEVLLHELAHVEEEAGERDHGDEFYERLVELTDIAAGWKTELEALFGESIDFDLVHRCIIESVHEETIEPDCETVRQRQKFLRSQFNLDADEHF